MSMILQLICKLQSDIGVIDVQALPCVITYLSHYRAQIVGLCGMIYPGISLLSSSLTVSVALSDAILIFMPCKYVFQSRTHS